MEPFPAFSDNLEASAVYDSHPPDDDITTWRPEDLDELGAYAHTNTPGVEILTEPPGDEHDAEHGANFPEEMDEPDADDG